MFFKNSVPKDGGQARLISDNYLGAGVATQDNNRFIYFINAGERLYQSLKENSESEPMLIALSGLVKPFGIVAGQDCLYMVLKNSHDDNGRQYRIFSRYC